MKVVLTFSGSGGRMVRATELLKSFMEVTDIVVLADAPGGMVRFWGRTAMVKSGIGGVGGGGLLDVQTTHIVPF
jgi:hypothetical protein